MPRPRTLRFPRTSPLALLLFGWLVLAPPASHAQGTGRALDIQPGARQNGMGAAGVALIGRASDALWWNPAALGWAQGTSGAFTRANLVPGLATDVAYYHAAVGAPLGTFGGLGLSFLHLNYGGFADGPFGTFGSTESSPSVGVGIRLLPTLSIGATLKWIEIMLAPGAGGETFSSDVGVLYRMEHRRTKLGFGAMYQNLGGEVRFLNEDVVSPLSSNYKLGVSIEIPELAKPGIGLAGALDYNQSDIVEDFRIWNGGIELYADHEDFLRFAGRVGYYYDDLGDIRDFTYGAGMRAFVFSVDGAWIPQARNSDLERVFKLTAGFHVGADLGTGAVFGQDAGQ